MRAFLLAFAAAAATATLTTGAVAQTVYFPPETTFTPVTPCRVFDTRKASRPARIPANGARAFRVLGTSGFAEQGGVDGGCGVPDWASAVSVAITTSPANKAGSLVAWSGQGARPAATLLAYGTQPASGTATVSTFMFGLAVGLDGPATDVTGDVTGYFAPKMWGVIGDNAVIVKNSGRVVSAAIQITGNYRVNFDRDITSCAVTATSQTFGVTVSQGGTQLTTAFVYTRNASGASVPGSFSISVDC